MPEQTWDGTTRVTSPQSPQVLIRQRLADCAKRYDWPGVFAVLDTDPGLVNAVRPGGTSWFAPLHQAAHAGAAVEVVERLVGLGAWRALRNAAGERPVDLARSRDHAHLLSALEPPRRADVPAETLRRIQVYFHAVIRARVGHLVAEHALRLPELDVLLELDEPRMSFPVPAMHGRFEFRLRTRRARHAAARRRVRAAPRGDREGGAGARASRFRPDTRPGRAGRVSRRW